MTVYVDEARNRYGRMIMSHMVADTIGELLDMADKIGLARRHFQPTSHPHFDVSQAYREKAISQGAKVIGRRDLVAHMRRQKSELRRNAEEWRAYALATRGSDVGRKRYPNMPLEAHDEPT